ncbi:MAG: ribose-phosphate pyrophosphokinase [Thermodesulfobacteriota bacterium]|nr:ribose-phosphate pyrophosphokinase [Thermodesulfobacteriota bacterium]
MLSNLKLFCGNSNVELAKKVCQYLEIPLGSAKLRAFSDEEISVEIGENVRGMDVFIVQSTCTPGNTNLMELLIMIDALKRASAGRITAVMPYYGYARQDRKVAPRTPITAKLVADLISTAGVDRILTMDLHAGQIQGFFNVPVDNLFATPVILKYIREKLKNNLTVVSPDAGGVERAAAFAKRLDSSLAIIDKRRIDINVAKAMNIIGEVGGKVTVLLDDMVDTAGTLTQAADALLEKGAVTVYACCTHPVLSGQAVTRIQDSSLKELVVTDTIPLKGEGKLCKKIKVLSVAELIGEAIRSIHEESSVSRLFV